MSILRDKSIRAKGGGDSRAGGAANLKGDAGSSREKGETEGDLGPQLQLPPRRQKDCPEAVHLGMRENL